MAGEARTARDHVVVPRATYQAMAQLVRGWDAWLCVGQPADLLAELSANSAAFCGSDGGSRMEEPLHGELLFVTTDGFDFIGPFSNFDAADRWGWEHVRGTYSVLDPVSPAGWLYHQGRLKPSARSQT